MRYAIVILAFPALTPALGAQEPVGPTPSFIVVSRIDTAKATIEHVATVIRHVPETRIEEKVEGGVVKKVPVTVFVPVQEMTRQAISLRDAKVFDAKGRIIPVGEALNRMKVGQAVVVSADGNMIHRFFARALRDDVLIIAARPAPPLAPAPPTAPK
ncbi:MAG: hypothetical protein U0793_15335 [Gemmataceae bacterium]